MRLSIVCAFLAAVGAAHAKVKLPEWEKLSRGDVPKAVVALAAAENADSPIYEKGKVDRREAVRIRFRRDGKSVELIATKDGTVLSRRVDGVAVKAGEPVKGEPVKVPVVKPAEAAPKVEPKADTGGAAAVSYMRDIAPLLSKSCVECHSARKRKADYDVSTHTAAMEGVVPGKPESSDLYMSLLGKGRKKMPPKGPLPAAQIELVRKWIADGAKND